MKTPEEMAEEYVAHNRSYPYNSLNAEDRYMKNSYLVGYKAAKTIIQEELRAVQAQRETTAGLSPIEYALKNVLAKMGEI